MNNTANNKKSKALLILLVFLIFTAVFCLFFAVSRNDKPAVSPSADDLVITNLNVGKADAAFIEYKGMTAIIDTGTEDAFGTISTHIKNNNIKKIDFMLITHYDKDHLGSAVNILDNYQVDSIYLPHYVSEKAGFSALMEAVSDRPDVTFVSSVTTVSLKDLNIRIIPADNAEEILENSKKIDNDMSLMCLLTLNEKRFLFTGDVEKQRIARILESSEDLTADWIKIPHHGGYSKNSPEFLSMVSPKYSVISTGAERPADEELLSLLKDLEIENYDTSNGDVVTVSDGKEIVISQ